jgi:hypothetical protein
LIEEDIAGSICVDAETAEIATEEDIACAETATVLSNHQFEDMFISRRHVDQCTPSQIFDLDSNQLVNNVKKCFR